MLHGYINKRMDNGSMEKQNLQKQASLKREAKKAMGNVSATVSFYEGSDKER